MASEPSIRASTPTASPPERLLIGGSGVVAAVAALASAACCVLPVALTVAGLGGAWLAHLAILARFEPALLGAALLALAAAWLWLLRQTLLPATDGACGCRARPGWPAVSFLGAATMLGMVAVARPWWEGPALRALWTVWTGQ
jgi:mercuric ion transport protein